MIKLIKKSLLILLMMPLFACADISEPYIEGEHYAELPDPVSTGNSEKIEVLELFWYGCPHCYALEPRLEAWVKTLPQDVEFVRMPAVLARHWVNHARAYYAAALLGVEEKTHSALFKALHEKRENISDPASLARFFAQHGVSEKDFSQAFKSFSVSSKLQKAQINQRKYRASGVPAIIVNGKYRVGMGMKGGDKELFDVVEFLIRKERQASKG